VNPAKELTSADGQSARSGHLFLGKPNPTNQNGKEAKEHMKFFHVGTDKNGL